MDMMLKGAEFPDGTVYLSTGKFTYDIIHPDEENYPLADFGIAVKGEVATPEEQELLDEFDEFEAQLEKELAAEAEDAVAKRKAKIAAAKAKAAAAKAKRIAEEEAAKSAETDTVDTEQSVEDEMAAFEAELAAELGH